MTGISDIDLNFLKNYLRIDSDFKDDDEEITLFWEIAYQYLKEVTGLSDEEYNKADTLIPALLILVSEMYFNRSAEIESNTKANPIINRYLTIHRKFL